MKRLAPNGLVSSFADASPTGKPRTYYRISDSGLAHFDLKVEEWHSTKSVVDRFINETIEGTTP